MLLVYDLAESQPVALFRGGQILRTCSGRVRQSSPSGRLRGLRDAARVGSAERAKPTERAILGYDRLSDGVRLRWQFQYEKEKLEVEETLRFGSARDQDNGTRR